MSGVSEATTIMTGHEHFALSPAPLQSQPIQQTHLDQQMRVAYPGDGGYRTVGSPPHPYQSITGGATIVNPAMNSNSGEQKRKRGRPRKYGPDGNLPMGMNMNTAPQPIPVGMLQTQPFSPPLGGPPPPDSQTSMGGSTSTAGKRPRGRPPGSANKKKRIEGSGSNGVGFIPHVINVNAGEDVALNVMAFSQNGPRAVCILSATGVISGVTLRQAASSGGTATYEGRFDILSLSGSYMPTNVNGQISRTGGLSITLIGPDGRVFGGCVAGVLTAATPVQVIVGSFVADGNKDQQQYIDHQSSAPTGVNMGGVPMGVSSSPSRGTFSESSGGPASPLNLSSGGCNNQQQTMSGMPWK